MLAVRLYLCWHANVVTLIIIQLLFQSLGSFFPRCFKYMHFKYLKGVEARRKYTPSKMAKSVVKSLSQQLQTTVYEFLNKPGNIPVDAKLYRSWCIFSSKVWCNYPRFCFRLSCKEEMQGYWINAVQSGASFRCDMNPYLIYSTLS